MSRCGIDTTTAQVAYSIITLMASSPSISPHYPRLRVHSSLASLAPGRRRRRRTAVGLTLGCKPRELPQVPLARLSRGRHWFIRHRGWWWCLVCDPILTWPGTRRTFCRIIAAQPIGWQDVARRFRMTTATGQSAPPRLLRVSMRCGSHY